MLEDIKKFMHISDVLGEKTYLVQLERMKYVLESSEYMISIMGQFSAGKSRLINNLIGKKVLPVHITETTAIITLIKYSTDEHVEIIYKDGTEISDTIDSSLELWQSGNYEKVKEIETVVIYVASDLLKTGLVIADTPGINTIINEHLTLAAEIMESSDKIMYVMAKPASETDIQFIEKVQSCGISELLVRTHMDNFKATEESIESSIQKEIELLQTYTDSRIFFVSNEEKNGYFSAIYELREYIRTTLTNNIKESIANNCLGRLNFIASKYKKILKEQIVSMQQLLDGEHIQYLNQKEELEKALKDIEQILKRNEERVFKKYSVIQKDVNDELQYIKEKAIKELDKKVRLSDYGKKYELYEEMVKKVIYSNYSTMKDTYINSFDKMLGENKKAICEELVSYKIDIEFEEFIPDNIEDTSDKIADIRGKIVALEMAKESYDEKIKELALQEQENQNRKEIFNKDIKNLREESLRISEELREYPEYEAQYKVIQEGTDDNEKIMRTIGNVLDWVTILIPGKAYVTAGSKVMKTASKVAFKIPKSGKIATKLEKTSRTLKNSKKAIKTATKIDKISDATKAIRDINAQEESGQKGVKGILDFFTFEHHFANLGKKFDKDKIIEIDAEYEKQYFDGKQEIQQRMFRNVSAEIEKRNKILSFDNKIKKAKMEEDIRIKKKKIAETEIKELKNEMDRERDKKIITAIKLHYIQLGTELIEHNLKKILEEFNPKIKNAVNDYIIFSSTGIKNKIQNKKREIEELNETFNSLSKDELENKLMQYTQYIKYLETFN